MGWYRDGRSRPDLGKITHEGAVESNYEFKKHQLAIGPDKPRRRYRPLTDVAVNFSYSAPIWFPARNLLTQT